MLCVLILHIHRQDLQFKVYYETDLWRNFSWQFLFTLRVFARNLLIGNHRRDNFLSLVWDSNPGFSFNKPTPRRLHLVMLGGNKKDLLPRIPKFWNESFLHHKAFSLMLNAYYREISVFSRSIRLWVVSQMTFLSLTL